MWTPSTRSSPRWPLRSRPSLARGVGPLRAAALALAFLAPALARAGDVAVVVNPSVNVNDLAFAEFRKIMLGERQFWSSGQRITLIVRSPVALERTLLLERVYKMTEAQYRQYWVAKVFRAEATSGPRVVLSNAEALELVGAIDGAISVVDSNDVPEGFKVLRIDGRLPGDPNYVSELTSSKR